MEAFKNYLLASRRYKKETITDIIKLTSYFLKWQKQKKIRKPGYNDMLAFLNHKPMSPNYKKHFIKQLRKYFDYLMSIGEREDNPLMDINLRVPPKPIHKPRTAEQINGIFETYRERKFRSRNQYGLLSVLGLVLYQALNHKEINRLRKEDFDLKKGTVNVLGTDRSNGRTLKLEACQILPLSQFLEKKAAEELIVYKSEKTSQQITRDLRRLGYHKISLQPLRESRIVLWMKQYNIREVQHLTGMKYVSSLQKYQNKDVEGLREKVKAFHPLGGVRTIKKRP